jgi:hypothetical protein
VRLRGTDRSPVSSLRVPSMAAPRWQRMRWASVRLSGAARWPYRAWDGRGSPTRRQGGYHPGGYPGTRFVANVSTYIVVFWAAMRRSSSLTML